MKKKVIEILGKMKIYDKYKYLCDKFNVYLG